MYELFLVIFIYYFGRAFPLRRCKVNYAKEQIDQDLAKESNDTFPLRRCKVNYAKEQIDQDLAKESNDIRDLFRMYQATKSLCVLNLYKSRQKELKEKILNTTITKNSFYILTSSNRARAVWNVIKRETGSKIRANDNILLNIDGKLVRNPVEVADIFGSCFQSMPINSNLSVTAACGIANYLSNIYLSPATEREIESIIISLPSKPSAGLDEIPSRVLIAVSSEISSPRCKMINLMMVTGTGYINVLTEARTVTPLEHIKTLRYRKSIRVYLTRPLFNLTFLLSLFLPENLQYLRLGDNNIHTIPTEALRRLHRLRHLDLRSNNISSIADDAFTGFGDSITFLNLQKNDIKTLPPMAFDNLNSLETLSLQNNKLMHIPEEIMEPVVDTLKVIDIMDNPLVCDCDLQWYGNWINSLKDDDIMHKKRTVCMMNHEHREYNLQNLPLEKMNCVIKVYGNSMTSDAHSVALSLSEVCAFWTLVTLTCTV
ncbi:Leucine rich repeat [Popillia japonica]|uniref:Leucine rich repeat n=1 Tax=Popillia japonica TaxID=7064 RepID=A0AAW1KH45_POPJA